LDKRAAKAEAERIREALAEEVKFASLCNGRLVVSESLDDIECDEVVVLFKDEEPHAFVLESSEDFASVRSSCSVFVRKKANGLIIETDCGLAELVALLPLAFKYLGKRCRAEGIVSGADRAVWSSACAGGGSGLGGSGAG